MKGLVTRCPHCTTAFRVGLTQMSAADGVVRCGVCNQIFHADKHLVETPLSDSPSGLTESYVRELLEEFIGPDPGEAGTGESASVPGAELSYGSAVPWMAALSAEREATLTGSDPGSAAAEAAEHSQPAPDSGELLAEGDAAAQATSMPEPALQSETQSGLDTVVANTAPEPDETPAIALPTGFAMPIEIDAPRRPPSRAARLGWTVGAVVAAAALALQYAWHARDSLALNPRLRPTYEQFCARAGCSLPSPNDIARIRSDALVIRPLPGRDDALSVDAELVNVAPFEQPWPGLEIVFSDIHGRAIAGRVFTPEEYLGAQPRGAMPVREVARVHFEIMEPDASATNYRMQLRELPATAN
jgi:predicted Zn finger-like uncharacterized protein